MLLNPFSEGARARVKSISDPEITIESWEQLRASFSEKSGYPEKISSNSITIRLFLSL
jgi:hypothetical protein